MMEIRWFIRLVLAASLTISCSPSQSPETPTTSDDGAEPPDDGLELPVVQYELDNGLTVMMNVDHSRPTVAAELVYLVGSGHERAGRTGFAHLFEHLMFQGSEHYDKEYFTPYEPIGAVVNGSTSQDRTNYYEVVPSHYAELPLWMESDRMHGLLPVLTQAKLDNQRDVVKNERRQRYEITPYGMSYWYLSEALFPKGHPYRHTPIGSHADLTAATLEDVKNFFRRYYVPANAGLALVGDFEESTMRDLVEKYFGHIPPGKRAAPPRAERPQLQSVTHWVAQDDVQLPRIYLAWHTPALFEQGDAALDLLSNVLSAGKNSRLFQKLVYQDKLAKDVSAYQISEKLSGIYVVSATAAPGVSLETLAPALLEALAESLTTPPTETEMTRARNDYKKGFYHRLETFQGRAGLLASYFLHTGQADYIHQDFQRYLEADAEAVVQAARKYLDLQRMVRLDFIPGEKGQLEKLTGPGEAERRLESVHPDQPQKKHPEQASRAEESEQAPPADGQDASDEERQ